jgi:hypothetical protein
MRRAPPKHFIQARPSSSSNKQFQGFDHDLQRQSAERSSLNLDLNLGSLNDSSHGVINSPSSAPMLCQRCHSSSHPRYACKAPIKCNTCFGWSRVAASCRAN